jgi:hypothetical protein
MPLAATSGAIGAVTQRLHDHLLAQLAELSDVTVGRPQPAPGVSNPHLNLFLYEVQFDGHLKNIAVDGGDGPPAVWMALRYLLTAFDSIGESDTIEAHGLLGGGIRSLQAVNFAPPPAAIIPELDDSPDLLKVTFDDATPELLSRLMQGTDERYRCSVGFQVRPVMIAPPEPPATALLVGVDYTAGGAIVPFETAVRIPVIPSLGPRLASISPATFEAGDTAAIRGTDLASPDVAIEFHGVPVAVTERRPDGVDVTIPAAFNNGLLTSAGTWPLVAVRLLPGGRQRTSNPLLAGLRPIVTGAVPAGTFLDPVTNVNYVNIDIDGRLLGTATDDVVAALLRDGVTRGPFDRLVAPPAAPAIEQSARRLQVPDAGLPAGAYRLVLRVNGQQARNSPVVNL